MRALIRLILGSVVSLAAMAAWALEDAEGGRDHPLLTRLPHFFIDSYRQSEFDRAEMLDAKGQPLPVEGRYTQIYYCFDEEAGGNAPSILQILRNYQNALVKAGGKTIFEDRDNNRVVSQLNQAGREIWTSVSAWNQGYCYGLEIVEKQGMQQEVVADAASMANDLQQTGRVALYGIYFDTGKVEVKPESEPSLKQIAELMKKDAALKLYVVGHTDNQGELAYNQKLSMDRAKAVVVALTSRHGVAASRLNAQGVGPISPVASNDSDEGRARNRRVELVKQ